MEKGIWIDTRTAFIVSLTDDQANTRVIESDIEEQVRYPGEGKTYGRFGEQFMDDETTKEERQEHQISDFVDTVVEALRGASAIVVFGPAEMKVELEKAIRADHDLAGKLKDVVAADQMTDNQKVAWVREYFGKQAPRKSV